MRIDDWPRPEPENQPDNSHITVDHNPPSLIRLHCGERMSFDLPMLADRWFAMTKEFTAAHRHCAVNRQEINHGQAQNRS